MSSIRSLLLFIIIIQSRTILNIIVLLPIENNRPVSILQNYSFRNIIGQFSQHCIVYVVLNTLGCLWTLNSILYCVHRIPNVLIARNQHYFWKTYEHIYTFVSYTQFDSISVHKCSEFLHENYQQQAHHVVYFTTIHSIQRYNGLCELTKWFSTIKVLSHYNPYSVCSWLAYFHLHFQNHQLADEIATVQ